MGVRSLAVLFFLTVAAEPSAGETAGREAADALLDAGNWAEAESAYRDVVAQDPDDAAAMTSLAIALRQQKRYAEALEVLDEAETAGASGRRFLAGYAITAALAGDKKRSYAYLERAVEARLPPGALDTHPGFESLRGEDRFAVIRSKAERLAYPCEHEDVYAAMDFWVGDWEVFVGDRIVGTNRIEKTMRGCIVRENWLSAQGGVGQSINYYDPLDGTWKQNWVDAGGGVVRYSGGPDNGVMKMSGVYIQADGSSELARVTLTPRENGTVHHLIEHSSDAGATWYNWFEAEYRPAKESEVGR